MTLAEKIGQMTQVSSSAISPAETADHAIGSILSGGNDNPTPNTAAAWVDMVGSFVDTGCDTRLEIPVLYGVDAVHGHSSVGGATIFPHNIGLGAAGDEDLVSQIGRATATELMATGILWTFAPTLAVACDIRWGRTYESYGRDPALVSKLGAALVAGLQGPAESYDVLACAKHFVGDGGTAWDSVVRAGMPGNWDGWGDNWKIDQGDLRVDEKDLRRIHIPPYQAAIEAGASTVMASYSSWNGQKVHAHRQLLTGLLKKELGFSGFVVSDWMAIDQIDPDYESSVITAINAGVDMCMVPFDFKRFIETMTHAVTNGDIEMARIDDAVRRILRTKARLDWFTTRPEAPGTSVVGSPDHRRLAAEAARRSAVLLKNEGALPLSAGASVAAAGAAANDIGLQCGGWTVGWQGASGPITEGVTMLEALRTTLRSPLPYDPAGRFSDTDRFNTGIVCIAETPYAEGEGDQAVPTASDEDRATFWRMREQCERLILVVYSGRPLIITDLIEAADAVIAAWLPGSEATGLPELLTGASSFDGRLSQPWLKDATDLGDPDVTPLFPTGHGLDPSGGAQ